MAWGPWESGTVLALAISIGCIYCCFMLRARKRKDKRKDTRKNSADK